MAQTGFTPIQLYSSSIATNVPLAANLATGELAINITDGKLFYKDNANAIQVIGWKTTPATAGGTGQTSYAVGDILYADTTTTLAKLADVATGNALISGGVGVVPSWGKIGLTTHISGTLAVANGGTGITSLGTGVATWLGTPSSANLAAAVTDETGSGSLVFGTTPTIATPYITGDTFTAYNATYASGIRTRQTYIGTISASGSSTITGVPVYYRGFMKTDIVVVAYNSTQGSTQNGTATIIKSHANNTLIQWGLSTPVYTQSLGNNDYRGGAYFTITAAANGNAIDITITNTVASAQTAVSVFFTDFISTN